MGCQNSILIYVHVFWAGGRGRSPPRHGGVVGLYSKYRGGAGLSEEEEGGAQRQGGRL